jgi:abhydrolase domain-containing protein 12
MKDYDSLVSEISNTKKTEAGCVEKFEDILNFRLLKDNPNTRLILYFHGTSGTLGSGWRPASYRALYAADPANTHILTFDYRGYGESTGHPSEPGLITDALAVTDWAIRVAGIPPERIVIFGQSLGSAVAIALVNELAKRDPAVRFAGLVVTASFADVAQLTATYRIGGVIPVLSPVVKIGPLFRFFTRRLHSTWDNAARLAEFVTTAERYHVTLIHAEDDTDIPAEHSRPLFKRAVAAAEGRNGSEDDALDTSVNGEMHGEGGSVAVWTTGKGEVRLEILKFGVHAKIVSYPVTSLAVRRAFDALNL